MFSVPVWLKIAVCLLPFAAFALWYGDFSGVSHYANPGKMAFAGVVIGMAAVFLFSADYARTLIRSQTQSSTAFVWCCHVCVCLLAGFSAAMCLFVAMIRLAPAEIVAAKVGGVEKSQSRGTVLHAWLAQADMPELVGQTVRINAGQYRHIRKNPDVRIRVRRNFAGMSLEILH